MKDPDDRLEAIIWDVSRERVAENGNYRPIVCESCGKAMRRDRRVLGASDLDKVSRLCTGCQKEKALRKEERVLSGLVLRFKKDEKSGLWSLVR